MTTETIILMLIAVVLIVLAFVKIMRSETTVHHPPRVDIDTTRKEDVDRWIEYIKSEASKN